MIQKESRLESKIILGAKEIMCIQYWAAPAESTANIGDVIVASVQDATPRVVKNAI